MAAPANREIDVVEHPEVPWLSLVFGYGPMFVITSGAIMAWFGDDALRGPATLLTIVYAASILAFLAGVRRGLSFRTEGGPTLMQISTMFGFFAAALTALVAGVYGFALTAIALLTCAYASIMVLDPIAARDRQAPLFFARLRPPQMSIAVLSLIALGARIWFGD